MLAGLRVGSLASGGSCRSRQAGSARGWALGLADAPGFLGAGPPPLGRDDASSFPPAGVRPGSRALSLHLSRRARGPGGASREGAAPRGHLPRRGLAPGAFGSPQAPPGRPRALGLTRLGYGAGEVGAGSLRGPSGALRAGTGPASPRGPGARAALGGDVSARPVPSDPLWAPGDIRPPAEHGWSKAVAATSFPPCRPGSPTERCRPRPIAAPARSQLHGLGAGTREPLGEPFQVRRVWM